MDKIEELETNISRTIMVISVYNSEINHLLYNTTKPKILFSFSFCSPTDKEGRIRELETPSTKDGLERETQVSLETSKYYAKLRLDEMRLELVDLKKTTNLPVN
jgi:hypothetical protein